MNKPESLHNDSTAPMSSGAADLTQTMLQTGMLRAPGQPGALGAVDRFEIIKPLAAGGMGQVFLAREPVTDGRVAIKMIRPELAEKGWAVERFLTEAQHMYRMSHPNILKVLEVSARKEGPYYVMPFVDGGSLADWLRPGVPLAEEFILAVVRPLAEALKFSHGRGIIHRDLKPANVLLDQDGHVYLTDFGLLRTVYNDATVDAGKDMLEGTAIYMSPLAAAGKAEDTRCDIYAFGAILYEMLTGQKPYSGENAELIIQQVLAGPPRPIREINAKAPPALVAIAEGCMARELRDRYAEMSDVLRDLARATGAENPAGPHGRITSVPGAATRGTGRWLAMVGAALQLLPLYTGAWGIANLIQALKNKPFSPEVGIDSIGNSALLMQGGMWAGVIGLILLAIATWVIRFRAPWFYAALFALAILMLPLFPLGTLAGILLMVYLRKYRAEFMGPAGEPGMRRCRLGVSLAVVACLVLGSLAGLMGWHRIQFNRRVLHASADIHGQAAPVDARAQELCARGWRAWQQQHLLEAEQLFRQATEQAPNFADAWNGLGWALQNQGLLQNAQTAFERAVAVDPKQAGALNGLGWIARMEGKPQEAIEYWERAVTALPTATAALAGLARCHLELGDMKAAEEYVKRWLAAEPANAEAHNLLQEIQAKTKDKRYTFHHKDAPLAQIAQYYSEITGKTVVVSPQIDQSKYRITMKTQSAISRNEVLRLIETYLAAYNLKIVPISETSVMIESTSSAAPKDSPANPAAHTTPRVIATTPAIGATDVDPAIKAITITFDQEMGGGFSWTGGGPEYPPMAEGQRPYWSQDRRTCTLPVKLEAGHYYRVGINSKSHQNFKSTNGIPVLPTAIYFTTRNSDDETKARMQKPVIVRMSPPHGAENVDPATSELRVTFDVPMGAGFSWTGDKPDYPDSPAGKRAYWTADQRTCVLPVQLQPGRSYQLGLNSLEHNNFQSAAGVPLEPVLYRFQTGRP